jgi:signal transduction histidine kinase
MTDITERKQAEEARQRTAEVLSQSNEEVRQFAYIVSHDLRTPLVNFRGFVSELRRSLADLNLLVQPAIGRLGETEQASADRILRQDVPEALGFLDSSVVRMDHLINALLRLSRLGRHKPVPERLDMGPLVSEILASLGTQIAARGATVTVQPLPEVTADRTSMEQILGNILGNAVLYLDPARPGRIEIAGKLTGTELLVDVRDNGRGIAPDDREKIFAPFRRAGAANMPGEGMGLAYVQALVRRQGGRIWFDSEPGVGTTFSFVLPVDCP